MKKPSVVAIYTAPAGGEPVESHEAVRAVAGFGLEGDRNFHEHDRPGHELTLVAQEAIDALATEHGIELPPGGTRRNVVTTGVDLDELVGRRFTIGAVEVVGIRPCHPCQGLEELTGTPGLRDALAGSGGLRADIVTGGVVEVGAPISWQAPDDDGARSAPGEGTSGDE